MPQTVAFIDTEKVIVMQRVSIFIHKMSNSPNCFHSLFIYTRRSAFEKYSACLYLHTGVLYDYVKIMFGSYFSVNGEV